MLSETEKLRVEEIMKQFNFDKVYKCMTLMNWTWFSSTTESGVPSLDEIKNNAKRLLCDAITSFLRNNTSGNIGTGGFEVAYDAKYDILEIRFIVTEWTDEYIKNEPKYKSAKKREKRKNVITNLLNGK